MNATLIFQSILFFLSLWASANVITRIIEACVKKTGSFDFTTTVVLWSTFFVSTRF